MMSSGALLTLRGVSHFFGSRLIFKGVSCALAPGSIMLVAGPNGAGKTTLLKIMAGLTAPRAGTVERGVPDRAGPAHVWGLSATSRTRPAAT